MKTNTEGHGRAADIWSVGCVVIEMASGKVCFIQDPRRKGLHIEL
jgi:serine/threonine protein kinase